MKTDVERSKQIGEKKNVQKSIQEKLRFELVYQSNKKTEVNVVKSKLRRRTKTSEKMERKK